jgi:hypothetical protein
MSHFDGNLLTYNFADKNRLLRRTATTQAYGCSEDDDGWAGFGNDGHEMEAFGRCCSDNVDGLCGQ